jgi:hypothetical protein
MYEEEIREVETKIFDINNNLQRLEQEKQNLLQELLRLDGERRALQKLMKKQSEKT